MMYRNNFVVAIKVAGKILRESSNVVTIPFGSEYSVLLKNLNSVRSQVKVQVDGTDATDGLSLVIPANGSLELERYIRNGNMNAGNRFKFIERSASVEQHRGVGAEDGLVRVEYWMERVVREEIIRRKVVDEYVPAPPRPWPHPWNPWYPPYPPRLGDQTFYGSAQSGAIRSAPMGRRASRPLRAMASGTTNDARAFRSMVGNLTDTGITVPGGLSDQIFHAVSGFPLESQSDVIVLQLRGEVGGARVQEAVTVDRKPECATCGRKNKAGSAFCSQCGTALQLV